ncbi:Plug domain-containing protein [Desulfoluna sp.]|uniref:Plug domain-containing protein n=1 Tax=Desulfoluna sp. TaxID=2045199 RepID=UPI00261999A2|nr:Plug domain-containing protein [Desulfoluna sp.]
MTRPRVIWVLLVLCVLVTPLFLPGNAGATQDAALLLDDVKVTASPVIDGNITDAYGARKTRVTEDQVSDLNAQDLETALRRTPGVNISRYNPIGSFGGAEGGGVFIRGMGSSRPGSEIKTLFDGIPMYLSVWNHPFLDTIPVDSARTIEVYKSPPTSAFRQRLRRGERSAQAQAYRGG